MFVASKLLQENFEKTFYTFGYAFAPLFVVGGLAHLISSFATHNYADIINGFIFGFGLDIPVAQNLTSRNDTWLGYLKIIPYIAALWGYIILFNRLKLFQASSLRKIAAFIFASSLISFYLTLIFYKGYVFSTYGAKPRGGHGMHGGHATTEMFQSVPFKQATMSIKGKYAFATKKDAFIFSKKYGGEVVDFQKASLCALEDFSKN